MQRAYICIHCRYLGSVHTSGGWEDGATSPIYALISPNVIEIQIGLESVLYGVIIKSLTLEQLNLVPLGLSGLSNETFICITNICP